jgi:hypothetical protein
MQTGDRRHARVHEAQLSCTPLSAPPHTPSQISAISDQRAAQTNAQPRPTQHDPARPSTTQHGSARLRTTQHGPEPLRAAPELAGRQINLLQIWPNFATHLIACMMAKPSCLSSMSMFMSMSMSMFMSMSMSMFMWMLHVLYPFQTRFQNNAQLRTMRRSSDRSSTIQHDPARPSTHSYSLRTRQMLQALAI